MANCKNCGAEVADELELCSECSAAAEVTVADVAAPSKQLNVKNLVWSIIIAVVACFFVAPPIIGFIAWGALAMGALGIVFTILAKNADTAEVEQKRLSLVKTFIRVGTILAAISVGLVVLAVVAYILYLVFMVVLGFGMGFLGALAG